VYNNDMAWYLWQRIQKSPELIPRFLPQFVNLYKNIKIYEDPKMMTNVRHSLLLTTGTVRAQRYIQMANGLVRLLDAGIVDFSFVRDIFLNPIA